MFMEQRRVNLSKDIIERLNQYDNSISHWSTELVRLELQGKALLENIDGLYKGRHTMLDKIIEESGIDPSQVVQMKPIQNQDGTSELALLIKPKSPPGQNPVNPTAQSPVTPGPGGFVTTDATPFESAASIHEKRPVPNHGAVVPGPMEPPSGATIGINRQG